ncbi:hypothetical protein [Pseudobacteroides cellulosolvens]|uniref:DUF4179 domain-containing protein n=1 Tax=Pseudobacteroides cellulosolvens ATCC 35603 = DSM 2933 TaxID=398512 RepID=A0A0L6JRY7_9FIRM|nr:hypothetical protein [Pseudobacteroides cellulosolvens]KNY28157.1 protein of unknown function DUF4179 [Pseudobacteroides cellulosolvens ATCC 35603 = DSM 2933]
MEEKIIKAFDTFDISETDRLLEGNIEIKIDPVILKRIKISTYEKAGINKKKIVPKKKLLLAAAVCALLLTCMFAIGIGNVADAFTRFFGFAPGYGILENNQSIEYIIESQNIKAEDEEVAITIKTAVASKDNISVYVELKRKNFTEADLIKLKKLEMDNLKKEESYNLKPSLILYAGDKAYASDSGIYSSGGKVDDANVSFTVDPSDINTDITYKIVYNNNKAIPSFKLKKISIFNTLDEIGSTQTHNNISITAITTKKDGQIQVDLYPINKSKYRIKSFTKDLYKGYGDRDLKLQTNKELKSYSSSGNWLGSAFSIPFNILPDEKALFIKIPYLIVTTNESNIINIKIPELGKKIYLNKEVKFRDSIMIITDVEKIKEQNRENENLKINLKYKNFDKNKIIFNARFGKLDFWGNPKGGGYSFTNYGDHVSAINLYLDRDDGDSVKLKIDQPEYYLLSEYNIKIKE